MSPVFFPALGALAVLAFDLLSRPRGGSGAENAVLDARAVALSGIRLGSVAIASLAATAIVLAFWGKRYVDSALPIDGLGLFGIGAVTVAAILVLSLSLTHFGMARCRPAEPMALLLFSWSGSMAAMVADNLLVLFVAIELAWLPTIALIALDSRRLSSSESSLKAFFAHVFASLVFAQGVAFLFASTGRLDLGALGEVATGEGGPSLWFATGLALLLVALIARAAVAPFHTWAPDVHEGAPSFMAAHLSTAAQFTVFLVLLRVLHAAPGPLFAEPDTIGSKIPVLLSLLGGIAVILGHAMALVQVGLRRLVGWLVVGQVGFLTLALVDARGDGGHALLLGLLASGFAVTGVMATLSSLSHHERACESIGDLAGMVQVSPLRAALFGIFLLSLGGMPGTIGFVARFRILAALEHGGHTEALLVGLIATVLALTAVGRPVLAMLRPEEGGSVGSRALSNEQFVLAICGLIVVYFGVAPIVGETNMAGQLAIWIERAVDSLRT